MIRFDHPALLWLLLLIPVWIGGFIYLLRRRRQATTMFVGESLLGRVAHSISGGKLRAKAILWIIAWAFLVTGAANPQVGTKLEEVKRQGVDVILAVDVSTSMECEDLPPTRLESAKHEILEFVNGLKGDRIGLIAFAGSAIMHCPLTTDYGAVKLLVRVLEPNLVPDPGTALADAIDLARKSFNNPDAKSRVLIIITDGEDHEERAIEAAEDAAREGIKVYTIGMGTPQGAPIPLKDEQGRDAGFKRDKGGVVVVTRLNDVLLDRIAEAGGGRYLRGTKSAQELQAIWSDISSMEKQEFGKKQFTAYEDRFQFLILPALLLLIAEFFVSERKGWALMERFRRRKTAQEGK